MTKTNEHDAEVKGDPKDHFSADLEALKSSLAQLREDVARLLDNTLGAGKSGAAMLKDRASAAVADVKDRARDSRECGLESVEQISQRIGERPLLSAAIALAIGFVLARVFTTKS